MGPGCAFLDYDNDGWLDILLANGCDWPGHKRQHTHAPRLYRNNRDGTFSDVTAAAGLAVEMYAMGLAVGDYDNDGFPDILVTAVGQNRLFRNTGKGHFVDVTARKPDWRAALLSARRLCGSTTIATDCSTCSSATTSQWSAQHDVFCSADGKNKSYCTPEAYRGSTCWLFRNRGDGTLRRRDGQERHLRYEFQVAGRRPDRL